MARRLPPIFSCSSLGSWAAARASMGLTLVAVAAACAHTGAPEASPSAARAAAAAAPSPPAAAGPQTVASPQSDANGPAAGPPGPLSLGIFDVVLPSCPVDAGAEEEDFCASATRAVRRAYEDDEDDPSLLLALTNALEVRLGLQRVAGAWRGPLGHALSRSEALQRIGPTLRLLRRSMADAYLDQVSQIYRGVNTEACRAAFAQLPANEPHWLEMVVTIEPLGTYPLSRLRRFCLDSRTLSRNERHVPGRPAAARLQQTVRQLWHQEGLETRGALAQIHVVHGWRRDPRSGLATAELAVGARRERDDLRIDEDPGDRCTVQILVLTRREDFRPPHLAWVHADGAIACRSLGRSS